MHIAPSAPGYPVAKAPCFLCAGNFLRGLGPARRAGLSQAGFTERTPV